jgi:hypothetical protein
VVARTTLGGSSDSQRLKQAGDYGPLTHRFTSSSKQSTNPHPGTSAARIFLHQTSFQKPVLGCRLILPSSGVRVTLTGILMSELAVTADSLAARYLKPISTFGCGFRSLASLPESACSLTTAPDFLRCRGRFVQITPEHLFCGPKTKMRANLVALRTRRVRGVAHALGVRSGGFPISCSDLPLQYTGRSALRSDRQKP